MKCLVYTAVFGDYDRVYPPVRPTPGLDHVIVTDNRDLRVPGWQTRWVDPADFATPALANRHFKMRVHQAWPGYDASLYVDGNIRLLGQTPDLFGRFAASGATLRLYRHPQRTSVHEEVERCIFRGQVPDPGLARAELATYRGAGFADDQGLVEATILLRNHRAPDLAPAMDLWWELYAHHQTRDQISLPFVLWKTGVSRDYHGGSFRDPNPYFAMYPHARAKGVNPFYAHVSARSHDSLPHRVLLEGWHASWALRRRIRALRRRPETGKTGWAEGDDKGESS